MRNRGKITTAFIVFLAVAATRSGVAQTAAEPDTSAVTTTATTPSGERWDLSRCIATALQRNGDVKAAHAQTVRARGAALSAWGGLLPTVSADLSYTQRIPDKASSIFVVSVDTVQYGPPPDRTGLLNKDEFNSASAGVQTNLFSIPAFSEKRRQDHLRASATHGEAETRNGVVFGVKQQYFVLLKAERLAAVSRESERLARDEESRAQALFDVGTVARGDVLKAKARRATTTLDRIRGENQVEVQRAKLKQILGLDPGTPLEIEEALEGDVAVPDSSTSVRTALRTRPEISRTLEAERAANAGLFGARAQRLPRVTGSLNVDRTQRKSRVEFSDIPELSFTRYTTQWQGQVALTIPIFDGFVLEGNMRQAKGAKLEAESTRRQRELDVTVEVQEAWLTLRESVERISVAKEGLASAEEDYKFSKGRYDLGAGTFLDLLNAEVNLSQAKQSYVEALADARIAEASLERATGERRY
jgi:outer membrane protein TolC